MVQVAGLSVTIESDRVVLHAAGTERDTSATTVRIEPIVPDPNAPKSLSLRGTVTRADGAPASGAIVYAGAEEIARADAAGRFSAEVTRPYQPVVARVAGAQVSPFVIVEGKYGETRDVELVTGQPAGALRVIVIDEPAEGAGVVVEARWEDAETVIPGTKRKYTPRFAERLQRGANGDYATKVLPPRVVRVVVRAKGYVTQESEATIAVGAIAEVRFEMRKFDLATHLRETRTTFRFEEAAVNDVLAYLRNSAGVQIVLMPDAAERLRAPVTLTLHDVPLETALRDICAAVGGVTFELKDDVVLVVPVKDE
jgi:hypothetical protein